MDSLYKKMVLVGFGLFSIGTTVWIWKIFGVLTGVLFLVFGSWIAGVFGMAIAILIAKVLGLRPEE